MSTESAIHAKAATTRHGEVEIGPNPAALEAERRQRILRDRARQLATRRAAVAHGANAELVLAFTAASERFCVPVAAVTEVLRFEKCASIPGGPPELLGVINVRGHVCSVLDLAVLLDLAECGARGGGAIVLVRARGVDVGLRVDQVDQIEMVLPETFTNQAPAAHAPATALTLGRTERRATILSVENIVSRIRTQRADAGPAPLVRPDA